VIAYNTRPECLHSNGSRFKQKRAETDSTTVQAWWHLRKLDRDVFRSAFPPRHFTQKGNAQEELQGLLPATKPPWKPSSSRRSQYREGRNEQERRARESKSAGRTPGHDCAKGFARSATVPAPGWGIGITDGSDRSGLPGIASHGGVARTASSKGGQRKDPRCLWRRRNRGALRKLELDGFTAGGRSASRPRL
jgi:hypothetical protein